MWPIVWYGMCILCVVKSDAQGWNSSQCTFECFNYTIEKWETKTTTIKNKINLFCLGHRFPSISGA